MNEKEIRALLREAEAAAKKYKAALNAKSPAPKTTKVSAKPKTPSPRGGGMRGPISLGGSGGLGKIK